MKFIKLKNKKKGYTLMETMVASALFTILSLSISRILIMTIKREHRYKNHIEAYVYMNSVINFIDYQLNYNSIKFNTKKNELEISQLEENLGNNKIKDITNVIKIGLRKDKQLIINFNGDSNSENNKNKIMKEVEKIEFYKKGGLLYVTVYIKEEKLTRCLKLNKEW